MAGILGAMNLRTPLGHRVGADVPRSAAGRKPASHRGDLTGKSALVVSSDLSPALSIVAALRQAGAQVILLTTRRIDLSREPAGATLITGDLGNAKFCRRAVRQSVRKFGKIDVLVNVVDSRPALAGLRRDVFSLFFVTRDALPYLRAGSKVINIVLDRDHADGSHGTHFNAVAAFTRSLALGLAQRRVGVSALAVLPAPAAGSPAPSRSNRYSILHEELPARCVRIGAAHPRRFAPPRLRAFGSHLHA